MRTRKIKRLFNGLASLRDYEVQKFINAGGVKLVLGNESMVLSIDDLIKGTNSLSGNHESKFGTRPYTLIDFKWKRS